MSYPAKVMKAQALETGNILLPPARMIYAALITANLPRGETDEKKRRWEVTNLFPPSAEFKVLHAKFAELLRENLKPKEVEAIGELTLANIADAGIRVPILRTAKVKSLAGYAEDYPTAIRTNSRKYTNSGAARRAPQVVFYPNNDEVPAESEATEIYAGRWCRTSVQPFFYEDERGGKGISLGLVNVQLLKHDDPLAGAPAKASQEFQPSADLDEDEDEGMLA
ncbi:hypothetical protein ATO13_23381 [Stappia sp. 22II-S9-Z10]|nr:hypothetical protein ATO13_23381 [Stappia sp. 22II-S9-Z10]